MDFPTDDERTTGVAVPLRDDRSRMLLGALAYVVFFVPVLVERHDPLLRFHARQGAGMALAWVAAWWFSRVASQLGLSVLAWVGYALCLILVSLGVYRALRLVAEPLPYVGKLFDRIPLWKSKTTP